jgi:predicted nucleic-acid-binding protein
MLALDTNLLVRLVVNDDLRQAAQVRKWLEKHATVLKPAYVDHLVLAELSWVLHQGYGYARQDIHQVIALLMDTEGIEVERPELVQASLDAYAVTAADFSDCLLASRAQAAGYSPVLTFDKKAAKSKTHRLLVA